MYSIGVVASVLCGTLAARAAARPITASRARALPVGPFGHDSTGLCNSDVYS
jgi:hypothetical protein